MSLSADPVASVRHLLDILQNSKDMGDTHWFVPERWNHAGYTKGATVALRPRELLVNPYDFFATSIEAALQQGGPPVRSGQRPLTESIIYAMLVRSFTAWPHGDQSSLSSGTFLKTMALLPLLKQYGVDTVYLLPVFATSDHYRKGQLGSPYAIRNIYHLDPALHDPLLGAYTDELLEDEFRAFVGLCHWMGMKVILDFAFRTTARDSVLIADHPDWFCWIRKEAAQGFHAPTLGDGKTMRGLDDETLHELYASPQTAAYLAQFTESPDRLDPQRWASVRASSTGNLLDTIEQAFGITTVPGFSDVINDQQPPWTDATYLRFYVDTAPQAAEFVPASQPPFVMQDSASLDRYPGKVANDELWQYVAGVLPHYRTSFGIDGARIDMAHALPSSLNALIVQRIRELDPAFLLWSEELDAGKGAQAQAEGFDLVSGFSYYAYKRIHQQDVAASILSSFLASPIPVTAAVETPDTPRSALIHPDRASLELVLTLNAFMPNAIPFINSGQELLELQPMNLGLDNTESGRFVLPADDPMAGRLAFFDPYCLHWTAPQTWAEKVLKETLELRRRYMALLADPLNFVKQQELLHSGNLVMLCYHNVAHGGLVIAANCSLTDDLPFSLSRWCSEGATTGQRATIAYDTHDQGRQVVSPDDQIALRPCEVMVMETNE